MTNNETPMEIPEDAPLYFIGDAAPTEADCPFCVGGNWSFSDEGRMKMSSHTPAPTTPSTADHKPDE